MFDAHFQPIILPQEFEDVVLLTFICEIIAVIFLPKLFDTS